LRLAALIDAGAQCVCLGDELFEILTHHNPEDGKPWPCQGDRCRFDHVNNRPRYRAYLDAWMLPTCEMFVVELTEHAARMLLSHPRAGCGLRGLVVHVYRTRRDKQAKMEAKVLNTFQGAPPDGFDVLPHLLKYWGLAEERANAKAFENELRQLDGSRIVTSSVELPPRNGDEDNGNATVRKTPPGPSPEIPSGAVAAHAPETSGVSSLQASPETWAAHPLRRLVSELSGTMQVPRTN